MVTLTDIGRLKIQLAASNPALVLSDDILELIADLILAVEQQAQIRRAKQGAINRRRDGQSEPLALPTTTPTPEAHHAILGDEALKTVISQSLAILKKLPASNQASQHFLAAVIFSLKSIYGQEYIPLNHAFICRLLETLAPGLQGLSAQRLQQAELALLTATEWLHHDAQEDHWSDTTSIHEVDYQDIDSLAETASLSPDSDSDNGVPSRKSWLDWLYQQFPHTHGSRQSAKVHYATTVHQQPPCIKQGTHHKHSSSFFFSSRKIFTHP